MAIYRKGGDPQAMRVSADRFHGYAGELDAIMAEVGRAAASAQAGWGGRDQARFESDWQGTGMPALQTCRGVLDRMAERLRENALAQEQASQDAGGGGLPGGPPKHQPSDHASDPLSKRMRGTTPIPDDKTMWKLSWNSYENAEGQAPPGWTALNDDELRKLGIDPRSLHPSSEDGKNHDGLNAVIYRNEQGQYVLAFRGTDSKADWKEDFTQGVGVPSAQYTQAVDLARQLQQNPAIRDNLVFTGHSLGGGLASVASAATGLPAVTFDAAGPSRTSLEYAAAARGKSVEDIVGEARDGGVRAYRMDTDILTNVQEAIVPIPDAIGTPITLEIPQDAKHVLEEQGRWVSKGGQKGFEIGTKVGNYVPLLKPIAGPVGYLIGKQVGKGAYGHHYHPMDAAMNHLFPG